jgi:hypothetical protein
VFTEVSHPLVGRELTYLPAGSSPYATVYTPTEGHVIMRSGDPVTVLSAWTRPYLDKSAPTLLYVKSHNSHECTHVTESDLIGWR